MVASTTASSSFVGEKERRTIEGLLYTPITDRELVLAKVLVSVIPSVLLAWAAFVVYTVLVNALGAPLMGGLFFPTWTWAIIIVVLVPWWPSWPPASSWPSPDVPRRCKRHRVRPS